MAVDEDEGKEGGSDEAEDGKQRAVGAVRNGAGNAGGSDEDGDDAVVKHGAAQVDCLRREAAPAVAVEDEAEDGSEALDEGLRGQGPPGGWNQAVNKAEDVEDRGEMQRQIVLRARRPPAAATNNAT